MTTVITAPGEPFRSRLSVPGDKSLSHRALILSAMAEGRSRIEGLAPGADVESTARALRLLGVTVNGGLVDSPGVEGWRPPSGPIDAGNSGSGQQAPRSSFGRISRCS